MGTWEWIKQRQTLSSNYLCHKIYTRICFLDFTSCTREWRTERNRDKAIQLALPGLTGSLNQPSGRLPKKSSRSWFPGSVCAAGYLGSGSPCQGCVTLVLWHSVNLQHPPPIGLQRLTKDWCNSTHQTRNSRQSPAGLLLCPPTSNKPVSPPGMAPCQAAPAPKAASGTRGNVGHWGSFNPNPFSKEVWFSPKSAWRVTDQLCALNRRSNSLAIRAARFNQPAGSAQCCSPSSRRGTPTRIHTLLSLSSTARNSKSWLQSPTDQTSQLQQNMKTLNFSALSAEKDF